MMTLNHGLSGYVCGRVAMPLLKRHAPLSERHLGWAFFLGALAPDVDILTKVLLGRGAYFSGAWYAHRHLSHSIAGTLLLALLLAPLLYHLPRWAARTGRGARGGTAPPAAVPPVPRWQACLWLAGCLWAGGLLHIVGDLFTPGWQMPVFWPLDGTYGALRHIGWFSPYLSWLFVSAIALGWLATFLPLQGRLGGLSPGAVSWGVFALAAYRWLDFLLTSRYESWAQWHAFHRALLPEAMIAPLVQGVSSLWHWFTG